ncbi:MAG TPA: baseplate J/gp47 family protein, partial [Pyrinomonadaceae bacterium]|nr:baseplate J/gp47 family protein [Pyrinomonadaceae bacterium]
MIQHLQCGCGSSKAPCGCCEGIEATTPTLVANRPGLPALLYRVGTHSTFLETMLARLSTLCLGSDEECRSDDGLRPLRKLTSRDTGDPSIALLDAWATIADVLTFYQERIANEGYLRTATERRSLIELGRLVGYRLRPGVAASVYLALTIENDEKVAIEPYEVRAQSVPGPGELPQSFENIEKIEARGRWNKLGPRLTQPQSQKSLISTKNGDVAKLYVKGITSGLNQGDPLLVTSNPSPFLLRVIEVNVDAAADRTKVLVESWVATDIGLDADRQALRIVIDGFDNPGFAKTSLTKLSEQLVAGETNAALADFIERTTLPSIARIAARRNIGPAFRNRLGGLSEELARTVEPLRASTMNAPAAAHLEASGIAGRPLTTSVAAPKEGVELRSIVNGLTKPGSVPPANSLRFGRTLDEAFTPHSDLGVQALGVFQPPLLNSLPTALGNTAVTSPAPFGVYAFRVKASPFGHSAPQRARITEFDRTHTEPKHTDVDFFEWTAANVKDAEEFFPGPPGDQETSLCNVIYLDGSYEKIVPESWIVVDTGAIETKRSVELQTVEKNTPLLFGQALKAEANISRAAYGVSGKSTRIEIAVASRKPNEAAWMKFVPRDTSEVNELPDDFQMIRRTVVYAQAEQLTLTEEPIEEAICTPDKNEAWIVLDGVYSELKSGRWVIVEGERSDLVDGLGHRITGVQSSELAMVAEVVHDFDTIPGDTTHTRIRFEKRLEYCYVRDKVTIYANVVKATHGETRNEVLGSGDGSKSLQEFALKQPPLTYVSATTPAGVESTLKIFVNDVEWHETESIFSLGANARRFVTTRSDAEVTTAIFGNGKQGARLPTGAENVRARYRQGIGKAANVAEGKITLLAARPLSVKGVINPRRASGGADPESREQARENTPLAVHALDRLVSTQDYSDFARTFGGVGKAFSVRLSDGIRELVHVTIAGVDDAPIEED